MCPVYPVRPLRQHELSMTPPPPPPLFSRDMPELDQKALAHQLSLEQDVAGMLAKVQNDISGDDELTDALISIQSHVSGLREFFHDKLAPEFWNDIKSDTCTIAQRTFDVPELLEMIIENLDIPDLMNFYQVNRGIRDAIDGSPKLQIKLCLRAAPSDANLRTPFRDLTKYHGVTSVRRIGFLCDHTFTRLAYPPPPYYPYSYPQNQGPLVPPFNFPQYRGQDMEERTVNIFAYFSLLPQQRLPYMGDRWHRMYVSQEQKRLPVYTSVPPPPRTRFHFEYIHRSRGISCTFEEIC